MPIPHRHLLKLAQASVLILIYLIPYQSGLARDFSKLFEKADPAVIILLAFYQVLAKATNYPLAYGILVPRVASDSLSAELTIHQTVTEI